MSKTINATLKKRISTLYPDKIISNLKVMDSELYNSLYNLAKEDNVSLKTFLENNGYSYLRKSIAQIYIEDYLEVLNLYKDKKVDTLYEKDNKLYYKILNHAKTKNFTLKQYLNSLGFEYELKKENLFVPELKKELSKLYKNNVIVNLSKTNPSLYYKVYQSAKKEDKTISVFLKELGFEIPEKQTRTRRTKAEIREDIIKKNQLSNVAVSNLNNKVNRNNNNKETTTLVKKVGRPRKNTNNSTQKVANVTTAPKVTTKKETTAPKVTTKKETTAPKVTTKKETTVHKVTTKKETTVPKVTPKKEITTPKVTTKKETTVPKVTTKKEISVPKVTTKKETTVPKVTPKKEITTPKVTTKKETTVPKVTTKKEISVPKVTTKKETTVPKVTTKKEITVPKVTTKKETTVPKVTTKKEITVPKVTIKNEDKTEL